MRIHLDLESTQLIGMSEKVLSTPIKDLFEYEDVYHIVVPFNKLSQALGKGAENVHKLSKRLNKKVVLHQFDKNPEKFISNIIYPLKADSIKLEGSDIIVNVQDRKTKSLIKGRGDKNLMLINRLIKRFFNNTVKII